MNSIKVWQALSMLGMARDGAPISEERARNALRGIGMREHELDEPYPEDGLHELLYLIENPDRLDQEAEKASEWMINRN